MIIYKITNKINGKMYVGQTIQSLKRRWACHCKINSGCTYISNAIQKYGKENFKIETIDKCDSLESLDAKEEFWIKKLNTFTPNGYNLTRNGKGRHSESAIERDKRIKKQWEFGLSVVENLFNWD